MRWPHGPTHDQGMQLVDWHREMRDAVRIGDFGRVIELGRRERRLTQHQLGQAIGLSQPAVSRLEKRGAAGSYDVALLARASAHLNLPANLVGLADSTTGSDVDRRQFLGGVVAAAAAPVLAPAAQETGQAASLRLITTAYRRLDASTPSRDLAEPVRGHLQFIQRAAAAGDRRRLASAGSEAASLAGWLAWDMGDHGSARTWYGQAVHAAKAAGDPLLVAYQLGSLAQFEAHCGNGAQALNLTARARRSLGEQRPVVAQAWLHATEALAHAAAGDQRGADRALTCSRASANEILADDPPPWPWVFQFNEAKVAAARVSCGARLGVAGWVLDADTAALATGNAKQRALVALDVAAGHLAAGKVEVAFALAAHSVATGIEYKSGRIVERARSLRRTLTTTSPPKVVREFDERLHGVYL